MSYEDELAFWALNKRAGVWARNEVWKSRDLGKSDPAYNRPEVRGTVEMWVISDGPRCQTVSGRSPEEAIRRWESIKNKRMFKSRYAKEPIQWMN